MDPASFLDSVGQLILEYQRPQGVDLAFLGIALKKRGLEGVRFGYPRLRAVLADLEKRGAVRVVLNPNGSTCVFPNQTAQAVAAPDPQPSNEVLFSGPFRPLRAEVWEAFSTGQGQWLIGRRTGRVLKPGESQLPDDEWLAMEPIRADTHRSWFKEWLVKEGVTLAEPPDDSLALSSWYRQVGNQLAALGRGHLASWNRFRSALIIAHAVNWANRSSFEQSQLFAASGPVRKARSVALSTVTPPARLGSQVTNSDLRTIIVQAIAELTIEELLEIRLPARALVRRLRPDLVGQ